MIKIEKKRISWIIYLLPFHLQYFQEKAVAEDYPVAKSVGVLQKVLLPAYLKNIRVKQNNYEAGTITNIWNAIALQMKKYLVGDVAAWRIL